MIKSFKIENYLSFVYQLENCFSQHSILFVWPQNLLLWEEYRIKESSIWTLPYLAHMLLDDSVY